MILRRSAAALLFVLVAVVGLSTAAAASPGQSDDSTSTTAPDSGVWMPVAPDPDAAAAEPAPVEALPATGPSEATQALVIAGVAALGLGLVAVGSARRISIRP
ncbi:MAG: LPXTG cell wall anchor domain-containing protein [Acidimicrobiia bacterium]|nr:LPXTG cell wall anchor domain-containing protein [Acidimicrobiia bacterium]